jgi:prepilin-type N-terminal cleavage/methylation domain-containing protein
VVRTESGYTLVEMLVASAVLLGVLVPATLFLGKITTGRKGRDLIIASQLAESEMERTTSHELYENSEKQIRLDNRNWRIIRNIEEDQGLVDIRIHVFKAKKPKPVFTLKTLRLSL